MVDEMRRPSTASKEGGVCSEGTRKPKRRHSLGFPPLSLRSAHGPIQDVYLERCRDDPALLAWVQLLLLDDSLDLDDFAHAEEVTS